MTTLDPERRIGLFGATSIGVGAIVGGGILALGGTAIATTGAGALLAFAANGLIAIVTALSFAELSSAFPQSGGTYTFAKRILSVGAAFGVGWVVWFASIVAAVLYAMGFAAFAAIAVDAGLTAFGSATPAWVRGPQTVAPAAILATIGTAALLSRSAAGGGNAVNVLKILVFGVLIGGGAWVWLRTSPPALQRMSPLLPAGVGGLLQAMGYTFIALQGFDLIAAVAGEVREPRRVLPRAMLLSLAIALLVYLPLLLVVLVVGVPAGVTAAELAAANPDTMIASAARTFLGPFGFWLVVVAGVLSMLSALLANLYAASRIAQAMSRDRTLPSTLERVHPRLGTPLTALVVTATICVLILAVVGDVAAAGAASSLIFLVTFALANVLCVLARKRRPRHGGFRTPLWPLLPAGGAIACGGLAVFQGIVVPKAGVIGAVWLVAGSVAYIRLFARRARVQDAVSEAVDPDLLELRGRSPLVLVPVANPANAGLLALLAACMSPARVGRVLLLHIIPPPQPERPQETTRHLDDAARVLRDSLGAALAARVRTEALATVAHEPWEEIARAARAHRCATVLIGMSALSDAALRGRVEHLASRLRCNVVIFRGAADWRPERIGRVLVPIGGGSAHSALRARVLTALRHRAAPELQVAYLLVLPATASDPQVERARHAYAQQVREEVRAPAELVVVRDDDVAGALVSAAADCDLLVLGLNRIDRSHRVFGEVSRRVIAATACAAMVISERV